MKIRTLAPKINEGAWDNPTLAKFMPKIALARKTASVDSMGRLALGSQFANKKFRITLQPDGNLLLEPVVRVPEREVWFYRNSEAQAMVQEGIRQSRKGKGKYLGSFAQYLEDKVDED